jgi:ATP-binding cassette subfamily B (MDR/TAP) protein 1
MTWLGVIAFVSGWVANSCFEASGMAQAARWRKLYLSAILRQDVGWFDTNNPGELSSKIAASTQELESGINGKLTEIPRFFIGQGVCGLIIAFYYSWDMSLVMLASSPLVVFGAWYMQHVTTKSAAQSAEAYGKAGGMASESISALRTVAALGAEERQGGMYKSNLLAAQKVAEKKSWRMGLANGMMFGNADLMACFGFIYGAWIIVWNQRDSRVTTDAYNNVTGEFYNVTYTCTPGDTGIENPAGVCPVSGGDLMIAIFCLQMGAMGLGMIDPAVQALTKARVAAKTILNVVNRTPTIDIFSETGSKPATCSGRIELQNIHFTYPARPDHKVCNGYNLTIEAGTTVALCGASGSGKSTAIQLIERFYDPDEGSVTLDGTNLKDLNVRWLRQQIGLVSQEPVLFSGTIADNIAMGKPGATHEEVVAAAQMANAHTFISEFPEGYDTDVGEKGGQLSGGQKQRVAIARAMIKDPAVLLLDEATSALDTESERVVQAALDSLLTTHKRTTIMIAHRLSTIRNADKICVVNEGMVVEEGTHEELMAKGSGGAYARCIVFALVISQLLC